MTALVRIDWLTAEETPAANKEAFARELRVRQVVLMYEVKLNAGERPTRPIVSGFSQNGKQVTQSPARKRNPTKVVDPAKASD